MQSVINITSKYNDQIVIISINRPECRNAVDKNTAEQLAVAFRNFDSNPKNKIAILFGEGGHFCAGADLKALASGNGNHIDENGDAPMGVTRLKLTKPVIAAISGYCVAGGLEIACWCDLRVCDETAIFGVFCRRFGVPLIDGGTVRLPKLIGLSRAMDLILTGRPVDAKEAFQIGLVNRLVSKNVLEETEKLALQLISFPQNCLRNDRLSVYHSLGKSIEEGMKSEFKFGLKTIESKELLKGSKAFKEGIGRHGIFPNAKL